MMVFKHRISFCWYWRNCWIGVRYSDNRHALYFNLIPFLSLRIELNQDNIDTEEIEYIGDYADEEPEQGEPL